MDYTYIENAFIEMLKHSCGKKDVLLDLNGDRLQQQARR